MSSSSEGHLRRFVFGILQIHSSLRIKCRYFRQFNPFVKQDDPETKQKMQELMQDAQNIQQGQPVTQKQNTETDFHFVTKTGARVKSIAELAVVLETMDADEFAHHVTPVKNDFAAWMHHAVKNEELASKIMPLKTKEEIHAVLKENS